MKYHEIIQDLSNMILIYEKFFFKGEIKPKNNQELFCVLIVQFINEKFRKIKQNVFIHLLLNKEKDDRIKTKYIKRKNTNFKETKYENNNKTSYSEGGYKYQSKFFNERNKINNKDE